MPDTYPMTVYHKDGRAQAVASDAEHKKLGADWSASPNEATHAALRKSSGAVAEVVLPVTRTTQERV